MVVVIVFVPALGYECASAIAKKARESGRSVRETALAEGALDAKAFDELVSPEAVCRLGTPDSRGGAGERG